MAVKLRLMRMGKTKQPTYRVVAADSHSPRNGRFIEIIGTYEPRIEPSRINIDNDRALGQVRIDGEVVTISSRVSGWITELPVIEGDAGPIAMQAASCVSPSSCSPSAFASISPRAALASSSAARAWSCCSR